MAKLRDRGEKIYIVDNEDAEIFSVNDSGNVVVSGTLTVDGATTQTGALTISADSTLANGVDIAVGTTTGTKIGTSSAQKLGFFNATPVVRQTGYTQTYSTADRTHANATATSVATTAATGTTPKGYTTVAQADAIVTAVNALIVDVRDVKQLVNAVIDDLQAYGLSS